MTHLRCSDSLDFVHHDEFYGGAHKKTQKIDKNLTLVRLPLDSLFAAKRLVRWRFAKKAKRKRGLTPMKQLQRVREERQTPVEVTSLPLALLRTCCRRYQQAVVYDKAQQVP